MNKEQVGLAALNGNLIELVLPVQQDHESGSYLGCQLSVTGRVTVVQGDRDCPEHIRIGSTVLLAETKVRRDWEYVRDLYQLEK